MMPLLIMARWPRYSCKYLRWGQLGGWAMGLCVVEEDRGRAATDCVIPRCFVWRRKKVAHNSSFTVSLHGWLSKVAEKVLHSYVGWDAFLNPSCQGH